jgi:tetratricopeptide (TPR) repeat protein
VTSTEPRATGASPTTAERPRAAGRPEEAALEALEEERDFLLRSLDDLERELAAGDVDEHDYRALKDDYTARAARTIRAIQLHRARARATRTRGTRSWRRLVGTVAAVAAFAVLAGVLVAQASGRREADDPLTGEIRQTTRAQLAEALSLAGEGRYDEAIGVYDDLLDEQPDNVEALTYRGWAQFLSGDSAGVESLIAATEADPEYPDTHAFLAIILERAGRTEAALAELERLDALDPPPVVLQMVAPLRERLEAQSTASPSTTTPP